MKRSLAVFALSLMTSAPIFAENLKSEGLKKLVAAAIQQYAEDWETQDLGSVWIVSYFDRRDGSGSVQPGRPEDYSFQVSSGSGGLTVDVEFPCGSEYDESELMGSCRVELEKTPVSRWSAVVRSCSCE